MGSAGGTAGPAASVDQPPAGAKRIRPVELADVGRVRDQRAAVPPVQLERRRFEDEVVPGVERDVEGLRAVLVNHPQVERVIAGHLHRPITVRFGGTVASTCPSPAHQVALDIAPDARDDYILEPPAFQLHWWNGSTLVTHTAYIGEFDGPYPFRAGGRLID